MPDGLYERDVFAWSEHQAALLRRVAAGEIPNEPVDWTNVIDEVQALGRSELRACESVLRQSLVHLLKIHAWPASRSAGHWRAETRAFLFDAGRAFSPSMRQHIHVAELYDSARAQVADETDESGAPIAANPTCKVTLDDLLGGDIGQISAKLA